MNNYWKKNVEFLKCTRVLNVAHLISKLLNWILSDIPVRVEIRTLINIRHTQLLVAYSIATPGADIFGNWILFEFSWRLIKLMRFMIIMTFRATEFQRSNVLSAIRAYRPLKFVRPHAELIVLVIASNYLCITKFQANNISTSHA